MDEQGRERERVGLAWALADLAGLLDRGVIDAQAYEALRRDYEARLRWLGAAAGTARAGDVPAQGMLPLEGAQASAVATTSQGERPAEWDGAVVAQRAAGEGATATRDAEMPPGAREAGSPAVVPGRGEDGAGLRADPPPAPPAVLPVPGGVTGLWINLTLFLGAFFVVMASLIFVISSWRFLGAGAKTAIMAGFTAAFIASGLGCLRLPKVRPAGQTFLAIGATLLPLDIVGAHTFFLRDQGISGATTWALGSAICALFYGALASRRVGRVYAGAAVVATVSAWAGALAALAWSLEWIAPGFLVLPLALLVAGRLLERTPLGRATFGPIPAWAAHLLVPIGVLLIAVSRTSSSDRRAPIVALALILVFYAAAALTQPREMLRGLHVAGACLAVAALLPACGWLADIPLRGYAATTLGGAALTLAVSALLRRGGAGWREGSLAALAVSWLQAGALLLAWGFFVPDGQSGYWALVFAGALAYAALNLWWLRQPWILYPLALAGALVLFHLLRIGPSPGPYAYAWAYMLAAFAPVTVLPALRRQGARRTWDRQLVVIGQALALGAAVAAIRADNRFQLAAVLWLFVVAGGAIAASERRAELLILPNLWGVGAVAATVALAGAGPRWAPAFYAGVGLLLALGLQGWRNVLPDRRPDWFRAQRWSAGIWAAGGPLLGLWFLADGLGAFLGSGELRELVLDAAYGPVGLAVNLCAAALAADAVLTLRRPTGYSASAVGALAVLMGIARITPNNPQAYAVPLGLYLLTLSTYVSYERDLGPARMPAANALLAGAVAVILGTTFLQSLVHPWRYVFLGLAEGLALLGVTTFLRRKYGVALALLFLTLTTLRAVFDVARTLPYWATIGLLGLALLAAALVFLLRRDRLEEWGGAAMRRWERLT